MVWVIDKNSGKKLFGNIIVVRAVSQPTDKWGFINADGESIIINEERMVEKLRTDTSPEDRYILAAMLLQYEDSLALTDNGNLAQQLYACHGATLDDEYQNEKYSDELKQLYATIMKKWIDVCDGRDTETHDMDLDSYLDDVESVSDKVHWLVPLSKVANQLILNNKDLLHTMVSRLDLDIGHDFISYNVVINDEFTGVQVTASFNDNDEGDTGVATFIITSPIAGGSDDRCSITISFEEIENTGIDEVVKYLNDSFIALYKYLNSTDEELDEEDKAREIETMLELKADTRVLN